MRRSIRRGAPTGGCQGGSEGEPPMQHLSTGLKSDLASAADYVERVRELGPKLDVAADEIERRRELPEPIVDALVERGLFRLLLPRSFGGAELPPDAYVEVIEEVESTTRAPRGVSVRQPAAR